MLILVAFIAYKFIYLPKKLFNFYKKSLEGMGYKVYSIFTPLGIPFLKIIEQSKKEGDALKVCKTVYRDHDVILTNSVHRIVLDFCHPDFIKDFYSA